MKVYNYGWKPDWVHSFYSPLEPTPPSCTTSCWYWLFAWINPAEPTWWTGDTSNSTWLCCDVQARRSYLPGIRESNCTRVNFIIIRSNGIKRLCKDSSSGKRKRTAAPRPTLCPTPVSAKSWANITNGALVQTLLINGAGRPGHQELTKQTRHGVSRYSFIPSVFSLGCECSAVWVRSMLHWGRLRSLHTGI